MQVNTLVAQQYFTIERMPLKLQKTDPFSEKPQHERLKYIKRVKFSTSMKLQSRMKCTHLCNAIPYDGNGAAAAAATTDEISKLFLAMRAVSMCVSVCISGWVFKFT